MSKVACLPCVTEWRLRCLAADEARLLRRATVMATRTDDRLAEESKKKAGFCFSGSKRIQQRSVKDIGHWRLYDARTISVLRRQDLDSPASALAISRGYQPTSAIVHPRPSHA